MTENSEDFESIELGSITVKLFKIGGITGGIRVNLNVRCSLNDKIRDTPIEDIFDEAHKLLGEKITALFTRSPDDVHDVVHNLNATEEEADMERTSLMKKWKDWEEDRDNG